MFLIRPFKKSVLWVFLCKKFAKEPQIFKINLRGAGLFSNVNEVVEQISIAQRENYKFVINWSSSSYRDPEDETDPWLYYFEPCFDIPKDAISRNPAVLTGGEKAVCTRYNIITPCEVHRSCGSMLLPRDRQKAHKIIREHIVPKPYILSQIESFQQQNFRSRMIGVHARGRGRIDEDIREVNPDADASHASFLNTFFEHIDDIISFCPDAGIFACSDSSVVISEIQRKYGERVIHYPSQRSEFGEMHESSNQNNAGLKFDRKKLGEEVLSEALLLSRTDFFIHSFSNVSNFVLCANPTLFHRYVPI